MPAGLRRGVLPEGWSRKAYMTWLGRDAATHAPRQAARTALVLPRLTGTRCRGLLAHQCRAAAECSFARIGEATT
jgi:hypothetical protein